MELLTFAIDDAYPEAICRGYRMNMLKKENYDMTDAYACVVGGMRKCGDWR